jgi:hypothetical protein
MQQTNHVEMVVEVCGIIEIGFTLHHFKDLGQKYTKMLS